MSEHASYQNRHQWAQLIKNLNFKAAAKLMQEILQLCVENNSHIRPGYEQPFAFAFSSLMSKLAKTPDPTHFSFLNQFNLSPTFLKFCVDLTDQSHISLEYRKHGTNIMLEVAGKHDWFHWAHYIYNQAVLNNIADAVTYGTAMKIFGREKNFSAVLKAFNKFRQITDANETQLSYAYGSMIFACRLNRKWGLACHVFETAKEKGLANVFILSGMIPVAGEMRDTLMACKLYAQVLKMPNIHQSTLKQAKNLFNIHVPDPNKYRILEKLLKNTTDLKQHKKSQRLSPEDPVYHPRKDGIKKDFGVIGSHLTGDSRKRNRYAFHQTPSQPRETAPDSHLVTDAAYRMKH